jgi:multidrug efflux system membrane fusion protein
MRETQRSFTAQISLVAAAADSTTHMVPVTAELHDQEHKYWLRPGSFCDVTVNPSTGAERLSPVVPRLAARATDHGYVTYVVEGDVAREKVVTLGMNTKDGWVEIRSGITAGDLLVVRGAEALSDGAKVRATRITAASLAADAAAPEVPPGGSSAEGSPDGGRHRGAGAAQGGAPSKDVSPASAVSAARQ